MINPEIWVGIAGYPWLEASNHGRIRTLDSVRIDNRENNKSGLQRRRGCILSPWIAKNGYYHIAPKYGTSRKKLLVHRLIALTFVSGHFEGASVNHIDGNKLNNLPSNLEWITLAENTRKQWEDGLVNLRGSNHPGSKLKEEDVRRIREYAGLTSQTKLAAFFGVSSSLIGLIVSRQRWEHI